MRALNKPDKSPREKIWCLQKLKRKRIDYFFMILDLGTTSFVNGYLCTKQKENYPLIKCFGPMYSDFDEYPHYSGRISEMFCLFKIKYSVWSWLFLLFRQAENVHMGYLGKLGNDKNLFSWCKATFFPKFDLRKECTYVQKYRN